MEGSLFPVPRREWAIETWRHVGIRGLLYPAASGIVGALLTVIAAPEAVLASALEWKIALGTVALIGIPWLIGAVHRGKVSVLEKLLRESNTQRDRLAAIVAEWQPRQALADELQTEWAYGLHTLRNANVWTTKEFARFGFERKAREWETRLMEIMKRHQCTAQEISSVMDLHRMPHLVITHSDPVINREVSMVDARLDQIRALINEHTNRRSTFDNAS